jgi:hypothetical protein
VTTSSTTLGVAPARLSSDEAHRIALRDAERVYRDLHLYRIEIRLDQDGWHVDFEFNDETAHSGGPHYIIDAADGRIIQKRYEQ